MVVSNKLLIFAMSNYYNMNYEKEFKSGNITITRGDFESMPCPMNTSSLTDNDMQNLVETIDVEMKDWNDWLEQGDISKDDYEEHLWAISENVGLQFGMTYYEDEG